LLDFDSSNPFAIHHLARYYDDRKMTDSAILYYQKGINPDYSNDYNHERLGYLLMEKNRNDTLALNYFSKILQSKVPGSWRPYYNIACYYSNQGNLDKAIEFLEKALLKGLRNYKQIYSDPFLAYIRDKEPFLKLMKKYFPDNK
jgi:tetratricopeptide (TPR) repeat protein